MQTLDARHIELFLCEGYQNGSWEYQLVGSHDIKKRADGAAGAIFEVKHLEDSSTSAVFDHKSWIGKHNDWKPKAVIAFHAVAVNTNLQANKGFAYDIASSSSQVSADEIFLAPEVREFRQFSEKSDVYSFGVFLLELLSGKEATESPSPDSNQNMVEWVVSNQDRGNLARIIDRRLESSFTVEVMQEYIMLIIRCVDPSSERRPAMSYVEMELDRILDKEMNLTTVMGEGTPTLTLGSQLFKASK